MKNIPVFGAVAGATLVFNQLPSPLAELAVHEDQISVLGSATFQTFYTQSGYNARVV